ncbi:hypothetical protein FB567DRAFT_314679 [Paraphoma chrysanthemicola]|uniref:Glycosyl transferase CAP10 domain-containing protein n=1 Tax=Paraphoma chrysanthemicola TaxID=798071 RepID=A0A8K0W0H7_9PLEO|nr:hypothetical protein FB567DRAFT_314679 [Paraphoma chrysanthemicola]
MAALLRGLCRAAVLGSVVLVLLLVSLLYDGRAAVYGRQRHGLITHQDGGKTHDTLDLNEQECRATFPGLFDDIDASIAQGKFKFHKTDPDYKGLVQGRVLNNKLHILTTSPDTLPRILHQRTAILSQIHRALLTSPSALPNTYFAFTINDVPKNTSWGFARPNKKSGHGGNTWIMPNFSGWTWAEPNLGCMDDILDRIANIERAFESDLARKDARVVWRGTPWFNPLGHPNLRKDLLKATKGKHWADVAALNTSNGLRIEDFCRYKYIVYTEGVTYSGRLPYHQACGSVLLMPPPEWLTTTAMLIKPIWADDLLREFGVDGGRRRREDKGVSSIVTSYKNANAVYVDPDFSNLGSVVEFLDRYPQVANRIAKNQRDLVVGGRYLSMGAETCYWRALIRGWSQGAVVDEVEWEDEAGERYEAWLMREVSSTRDGTRGKTINTSGAP